MERCPILGVVNTKLINYIKTEEAQGYKAHQLHDFLIKKGYPVLEVDEAITYANRKDITTTEQQTGFANSLEFIKRRNSVWVFLLSLFTGGIYTVIWYMSTVTELKQHQQHAPNKFLSLLLLLPQLLLVHIVFFLNSYHGPYIIVFLFLVLGTHLVAFVPYTRSLTRLTGGNSGILLSLLIFAPSFGVLATQEELNSRAHYKSN